MSTLTNKRITFKRARPNPLFQDWLKELHEEARAKRSKLEPMLQEALSSISKYPLTLQTGAECAILKGFDRRLCLFIDKRLEVYNGCGCDSLPLSPSPQTKETGSRNKDSSPSRPESPKPHTSQFTPQNENTDLQNQNFIHIPKTRSKKQNTYKPSYRSGGYAILIALLEYSKENKNNPALKKEDLIERAQRYSEESFTRPKPDSFYTAWSNMSRLIKNGYVTKCGGKNAQYSLTKQGLLVANNLLDEAGKRLTNNDIIFNDASPFTNVPNHISDLPEGNEKIPVLIQTNSTDHTGYYEMLPGSFDIVLIIDKNETRGVKMSDPTVAQFNKYPDLKHEYRSLKVGDFTWIAKDKTLDRELVLPYIVERKRMDDLGASIKDGRFHEQKFRLRKCGMKNVIYLVENYGRNKHVGLPMQTLMQSLANTRVQDGFKVHMTGCLNNSVRFLAMMTKRLTVEYKKMCLKGCDQYADGIEKLMSYTYFNQSSIRNKTLTVTETFIMMLLQLKGVSVEKALAITNVYRTPKSLIKEYEKCNRNDGEMLLANLKYGDANRNVGPSISKNIYQLFCNRNLM